jgi:hypothetical protein
MTPFDNGREIISVLKVGIGLCWLLRDISTECSHSVSRFNDSVRCTKYPVIDFEFMVSQFWSTTLHLIQTIDTDTVKFVEYKMYFLSFSNLNLTTIRIIHRPYYDLVDWCLLTWHHLNSKFAGLDWTQIMLQLKEVKELQVNSLMLELPLSRCISPVE